MTRSFRLQAETTGRARGVRLRRVGSAARRSCRATGTSAKVRHGRGPGYKRGRAAPAGDRRLRRAQAAARSISDERRRRPRRGASAGARAARSTRYERAEGASRRARLPRSAAQGAATWCAATPACGAASSARFTHIFVDEFQDTDPLQAEILLLLARRRSRARPTGGGSSPSPAGSSSSAIPKQSIYRFRRADVGIYRDVCERLVQAGAHGGPADHQLPQRAGDPGVRQRGLRAGDDRRCRHAAGRLRPARAVSRRRSRGSRRSSRCRCRSRTACGTSSAIKIEQSLPDAVGAFIDWLVQRERLEGDRAQRRRAGRRSRQARLHPLPAIPQLRRAT